MLLPPIKAPRMRYECAMCDRIREDVNHWFMAQSDGKGGLRIWPWTEDDAKVQGVYHLCGVEDLMKFVGAYAEAVRSALAKGKDL